MHILKATIALLLSAYVAANPTRAEAATADTAVGSVHTNLEPLTVKPVEDILASGRNAAHDSCEITCSMCYKGIWTNYLVAGKSCGSHSEVEPHLHALMKKACTLTSWKYKPHGPSESWHHNTPRPNADFHAMFTCPLGFGIQVGAMLQAWKGLFAVPSCNELC